MAFKGFFCIVGIITVGTAFTMNYCEIPDLIEQYGGEVIVRLTDKVHKPASTIDPVIAGRAIADACAEIDLYLHSRYKLPLTETPAIIKRLACTLTFANLHTDAKADHPAHERAKEARSTLRGIASSTLSIGLSETGSAIEGGDTIQFSAGRNDWQGVW